VSGKVVGRIFSASSIKAAREIFSIPLAPAPWVILDGTYYELVDGEYVETAPPEGFAL
jgi:hypothetical protein